MVMDKKMVLQKFKAEIVTLGLISIFFLPFCGFMFGCGCSFLWSGALSHCNIHNPMPPNCPWCTGPLYLQMIPFLVVCVAAYAGIKIMRHFNTANFFLDAAAGLLVALVTGVLLALIYKTF
jgi:hypothetical protein